MILKYLFFLILLLFNSPKVDSQVFRITDNSDQDRAPKIIKDLDNRIWCFWENGWQQGNQIKAKYFENEQWSTEQVIVDSGSYVFNVSLDKNSGLIWLLVNYFDSLSLLKGQKNGFQRVATYYNSNYYVLERGVFDVIDSNNVWMDLSISWCFYHYFQFNGITFEVYESDGLGCWVCDYLVRPKSSIVINNNKIYYLRDGDWHCHGGFGGPFQYLFYFNLDNNSFVENKVEYKENANASVIGRDSSSFLYFFYRYDEQESSTNYVDFINADADTIVKSISNINFFPQAATKNDSICSLGWINDSTISYKNINDTTFYKTKCIPVAELYNADFLYDLRIESGVGRNVWLTWEGMIDNQFEIFVARQEISTEIDSDYITSVQLKDIKIGLPSSFELFQNYPNPFNSSTIIKFSVPSSEKVSIKIFDVLGNEIETILNRFIETGLHEINYSNENLASGVYLYQLKSGEIVKIKKMILLR